MYKHTIHDGSVSYSVTLPDPPEGNGKHYKRPEPIREVLRRIHMACIGHPNGDRSTQLQVDRWNRSFKKSMKKIRV